MSAYMAAAAKLLLDIEAMQEDFFADSTFIGIASALPSYRFCWILNNYFNLKFQREPDMDVKLPGKKDNPDTYFSVYQYIVPTDIHTYTLYSLKTNDKSLLPEVKQLDYLWMIQSVTPEKDAANYLKFLRNIPEVQLAQILHTSQLKNLNNLLV